MVMVDLLIRNVSSGLKKKLESSARKHRRSLSEEAKRLLDEGLVEKRVSKPLGTALVEHFKDVAVEDFVAELDALPRRPPDFE